MSSATCCGVKPRATPKTNRKAHRAQMTRTIERCRCSQTGSGRVRPRARRVEKLEATREKVEAIGRRCVAIPGDVSDPEDCNRVVEETVKQLGKVDVLINNAGVGTAAPATRESPDDFRRVIDINLNGSY